MLRGMLPHLGVVGLVVHALHVVHGLTGVRGDELAAIAEGIGLRARPVGGSRHRVVWGGCGEKRSDGRTSQKRSRRNGRVMSDGGSKGRGKSDEGKREGRGEPSWNAFLFSFLSSLSSFACAHVSSLKFPFFLPPPFQTWS